MLAGSALRRRLLALLTHSDLTGVGLPRHPPLAASSRRLSYRYSLALPPALNGTAQSRISGETPHGTNLFGTLPSTLDSLYLSKVITNSLRKRQIVADNGLVNLKCRLPRLAAGPSQ